MKINIYYLLMAFATATILAACSGGKKDIRRMAYPAPPTDSSVVDNYHGREIADFFRPLEDDNSKVTGDWVAAQNMVTNDYLDHIPYRSEVKQRLMQLHDYPRMGVPMKHGEYYFTYRNTGLQQRNVLYCQKGLNGHPEIFLDPNEMSEDCTISLFSIDFSPDEKMVAYAVSVAGSDWVEIRVMEVESRRHLSDSIKWVKFSGVAWANDGFYYSSFEEPKGNNLSALNDGQKIYFHKVGTPQSCDKLIYEDQERPLLFWELQLSEDRRWMFLYGSEGTHGTELLFKEAGDTGPFKKLFAGFSHDYRVITTHDDKALILTNRDAENFKLVEVCLSDFEREPKTIISEDKNLLEWVGSAGGALFAAYLRDATTEVIHYDITGRFVRKIELPGLGTVTGFDGKKQDTEIFFTFTGFTTPFNSYLYDITVGKCKLFHADKGNFDEGQFTSEQVFYTSKDGTKVPMFLVYKKGIIRDGNNPVCLHGYGGFNMNETPKFSASHILFLEQGGIYATANIRGGGEYGERWHREGMLDKKQNVFDDFIAAAEWLIANNYTSPHRLAIMGGSNGGLLVGACMTQRPELFAVAIPLAGLHDMLRYHKFTIGWAWAVEYGSSEDSAQFHTLLKYSPLHNLKEGVSYPATLITTADHDDRVVPAHSLKFAARLQQVHDCDTPALIRIDSNTGHESASMPISKVIDEDTDVWTFALWHLGSYKFKHYTDKKL